MTHPVPAVRISLDGVDVTGKIMPRLVNLTLTDCRSDDSDQLDITLCDADGQLAIPRTGVKIHVRFGWQQSGLVDKGLFTVDEVEHSGAPDVVTLRARTASLIDTFRQVQERSFHDTTLGTIMELIAFGNELKVGMAEELRQVKVAHIDQTQESDAAFLRRLGKQYDAVATVKNDTLLFLPAGRSKTASGKTLPTIRLTRASGDQHRFHRAERDSYTGVRVFWYDAQRSLRRSVVAGIAGNSKRLRTTYASEADARVAAIAEWQKLQRGLATFELSLALGDAALMSESPVVVSGFKPDIDGTEWVASKVISSISDAGFTTRIEMETKTAEAEAKREEQVDPDAGITGVLATWRDKVSKTQGEQLAGSRLHPKTLPHCYTSKQSAVRAAKLAWAKIQEQREIIAENGDGA